MNGIDLIKQERLRQIYEEGWTTEHDDEHTNNELALAAVCYALPTNYLSSHWPSTWDKKWYKPTTRIKDLTKAASLLVAEIERLQRIEIKKAKEKLIPKIKKLVDEAFEKFGEENDNIIILSSCYYSDDSRSTYEIDEPLRSIGFLRKDTYGSKLYFPIGKNWDLGSWNTNGSDDDKLNLFNENYVYPICGALDECGIDCISEEYFSINDNEAINEVWCGCIGIMKDYKIVSFVIRDDGWLCSENSINNGYNKIIEQL